MQRPRFPDASIAVRRDPVDTTRSPAVTRGRVASARRAARSACIAVLAFVGACGRDDAPAAADAPPEEVDADSWVSLGERKAPAHKASPRRFATRTASLGVG